MGFLTRISSVSAPARMQASSATQAYRDAFWAGDYVPQPWLSLIAASGITVTADLAMTLSAFYSGVTMIGRDLATLPCQAFRRRQDGGKDLVRTFYGEGIDTSGGISSMAYMLRWQPNVYQTATEFWLNMIAQYLMRAKAYAEIITERGMMIQLLPRHPDRVTAQRLPSGRLQYRLSEGGSNQPRYLTQDEMFVVRDLSLDGINSLGRVEYGAQTIGTILAAEQAAGRFFKTGMTAALLASYKGGQMEDADEDALHKSISRYASGVDNTFGLLLVPDDVNVTNLAIEPEKAQMMQAREWGVREIARLLNIPGAKLGIKDAVSYASAVQVAVDYVIGCLRPIAVTIEQSIQRDLVLRKDAYLFEFFLPALLRGDPEAMASYIEKLIKVRVIRPSEGRQMLNMNPDADLDRLSEQDFRPGSTAATGGGQRALASHQDSRAVLKGMLSLHDSAMKCVRRERDRVEQLAKKHANNMEAWQASLREYFADHAGYVAREMRLHPIVAHGYAAQRGSELEAVGAIYGDEWERWAADELCALALDSEDRQAA